MIISCSHRKPLVAKIPYKSNPPSSKTGAKSTWSKVRGRSPMIDIRKGGAGKLGRRDRRRWGWRWRWRAGGGEKLRNCIIVVHPLAALRLQQREALSPAGIWSKVAFSLWTSPHNTHWTPFWSFCSLRGLFISASSRWTTSNTFCSYEETFTSKVKVSRFGFRKI